MPEFIFVIWRQIHKVNLRKSSKSRLKNRMVIIHVSTVTQTFRGLTCHNGILVTLDIPVFMNIKAAISMETHIPYFPGEGCINMRATAFRFQKGFFGISRPHWLNVSAVRANIIPRCISYLSYFLNDIKFSNYIARISEYFRFSRKKKWRSALEQEE